MNAIIFQRRRGSTAVEFALVLITFLTFVLFIVDIARLVFMMNTGSEAALLGARYAIVCANKGDSDTDKERVLARMQVLMPELTDIEDIELNWVAADNGSVCNVNDCAGVTVRITGLNFRWVTPFLGAVILPDRILPEFATYLPRESMRQDLNSETFCTTM